MSVTPDQLPCSPLESPAGREASVPYLEYWRNYQTAFPRQRDADDLRRLAVAGSVLVREPDMLKKLPASAPVNMSSSPTEIIEAWDRSLGPFNPFTDPDATYDLIRGAAMMLQANHSGNARDFPVVRVPDPTDTVDAFLDISGQLDIERQRPTHALLIGAQLVHKAAWTEQDSTRQRDLFGAAGTLYSRLTDPNVALSPDRLKAGQFLRDILAHDLSRRIREDLDVGENPWRYRDEAVRIQRAEIADLIRYYELIKSSPSRAIECELAGEMAEPFTTFGVRNRTMVLEPLVADHLEIRTAFDSEDEPREPSNRTQDSKFDRVLTRFSADGSVVDATPVQLKTGDGEATHARPYHPAIKVVTLRHLGSDNMVRIARETLRNYDNEQFGRIVAGLNIALAPMDPYLETIPA
jgi:hypothetical protein